MLGLEEIVPLSVAQILYPRGHPRAGRRGVVNAFLIRHPDGPVLVDTGIGPPHPDIDPDYQPRRVSLDAALAVKGVQARQVRLVLNTHLHFDHCGGNYRFPGIPIAVQGAEYEAAQTRGYTVPEWVDFPRAKYRLIRGDMEIVPGIRILSTPGHTPGHQSVVVTTSEGAVVIAGHAIGSKRAYDRVAEAEDRTTFGVASAERLRTLAPRRVFFSHDRHQWNAVT